VREASGRAMAVHTQGARGCTVTGHKVVRGIWEERVGEMSDAAGDAMECEFRFATSGAGAECGAVRRRTCGSLANSTAGNTTAVPNRAWTGNSKAIRRTLRRELHRWHKRVGEGCWELLGVKPHVRSSCLRLRFPLLAGGCCFRAVGWGRVGGGGQGAAGWLLARGGGVPGKRGVSHRPQLRPARRVIIMVTAVVNEGRAALETRSCHADMLT
jgi:hypothetical protein